MNNQMKKIGLILLIWHWDEGNVTEGYEWELGDVFKEARGNNMARARVCKVCGKEEKHMVHIEKKHIGKVIIK